jgi:hypothetical protein
MAEGLARGAPVRGTNGGKPVPAMNEDCSSSSRNSVKHAKQRPMVPRIAVRVPRHSGQSVTINDALTTPRLPNARNHRPTRLRRQHERAESSVAKEMRESPTAKGCRPSSAMFVGPMDVKKRLAREVQDGCPAGRKGKALCGSGLRFERKPNDRCRRYPRSSSPTRG